MTAVAACGGTPIPSPAVGSMSTPQQATGQSASGATAPGKTTSSGETTSTGKQASLPPREFPVPRAADLIGLDRDRITELLGKPTFVRHDPPAEFWRYDQSDCVLELIFYDKKGGKNRLSYIETRRAGHDGKAIARCLKSVVANRAKG